MTFGVFEPVSFLDSCYDGPAYRQRVRRHTHTRLLLGDCALNFDFVFGIIKIAAQCVFDLDALRVLLRLDKSVQVCLLGHGNGNGGCSRKNEFGHYI